LFHFDQLPIGPIKIVYLQQEKWISGGKTFHILKQVRETSYLTILRPTLEYAAMVCDPTT
jgi:peptidase E